MCPKTHFSNSYVCHSRHYVAAFVYPLQYYCVLFCPLTTTYRHWTSLINALLYQYIKSFCFVLLMRYMMQFMDGSGQRNASMNFLPTYLQVGEGQTVFTTGELTDLNLKESETKCHRQIGVKRMTRPATHQKGRDRDLPTLSHILFKTFSSETRERLYRIQLTHIIAQIP